MTYLTCEIGGDYRRDPDGKPVCQRRCTKPATHEYRPADPANPNWDNGRWSTRCAEHIGWLDKNITWDIRPAQQVIA